MSDMSVLTPCPHTHAVSVNTKCECDANMNPAVHEGASVCENTQTHDIYTQTHYTNPRKCHSVACEKRKGVKMLVPGKHSRRVPQRNKQTLLNWCRFGME